MKPQRKQANQEKLLTDPVKGQLIKVRPPVPVPGGHGSKVNGRVVVRRPAARIAAGRRESARGVYRTAIVRWKILWVSLTWMVTAVAPLMLGEDGILESVREFAVWTLPASGLLFCFLLFNAVVVILPGRPPEQNCNADEHGQNMALQLGRMLMAVLMRRRGIK